MWTVSKEAQKMEKEKTYQIISAFLLNMRVCPLEYFLSATNVLSALTCIKYSLTSILFYSY